MPDNIENAPSQVLKALRALRCDAARELSKELEEIMEDIKRIDDELLRRTQCQT